MSKQEVSNLACKLLAIYTMVNGLAMGLSSLVYGIGQWRTGSTPVMEVVLMSSGPLFILAAGIVLWFFSDKISNYIGKEKLSETTRTATEKTVEEIQIIAYSVLGLFFIGSDLPKAVSPIITFVATSSHMGPGLNWQVQYDIIGQLLQVAVQLVFGLWLMLGAQGLVNLLKKLRTAGVQQNHDRKPDSL